MPIVIPAGYSQITMVHSVPGAHGEVDVTWGIENNDTELADLEFIRDNWQENVLPFISSPSVSFEAARSLRGPRPGSPALEIGANPLLPVQGAQDPDMLPINNAILVQVQTALGGVRFRGRKYLPGPAEEAVDNAGLITVGYQTQVNNAMQDFFDAQVGNASPLVLLHGTGISPTPVPTTVTGLFCTRKMATQRTRLRG